jgi:RNA polymerase sigma-70 factor, ECF subfamily
VGEDGRTDAELLADHLAGDRAAFGVLAARHGTALWRVAARMVDPDDAEDAVQEALIAAFRRAAGFRGDAAVRTWLHRIVVNTCIDRIRREKSHITVGLPERETADRRPDPAVDVATKMVVNDALASLSVEYRLAVLLVDVEGWSMTEAAQVLEVPVGTVKSRCSRGRARLAVLLGHLREEA